MYKHISINELKAGLKTHPEAIVLDVRTPMEWEEGVIENAVLIDLMGGRFIEEVETLDKNKKYFVVCRGGNRSQTACGAMEQHGFSDLSNVSGGMMAWDGPVVSPQ